MIVPDADQWADLVTTALLGTDRRPLPDGASAGPEVQTPPDGAAATLLDLAAAHRATAEAAGALARCPAGPTAPAERLPLAPAAAQRLLGCLMARPEPTAVNHWLAICAQLGLAAAVQHWPRLVDLAARSSGYDRSLLQAALGPRGVWLLVQNPRWAHLAAAATPGGSPPAPPEQASRPVDPVGAAVREERELAVRLLIEEVFAAEPVGRSRSDSTDAKEDRR